MKLRKIILFVGLILLQLLALPREVYGMDHVVMAVMKKKHDVHTNTHFQKRIEEIFYLLFAVILKRISYS
ncbi:hypothetical protein ACIXNL_14205 [Bacteroides fragilis]